MGMACCSLVQIRQTQIGVNRSMSEPQQGRGREKTQQRSCLCPVTEHGRQQEEDLMQMEG